METWLTQTLYDGQALDFEAGDAQVDGGLVEPVEQGLVGRRPGLPWLAVGWLLVFGFLAGWLLSKWSRASC